MVFRKPGLARVMLIAFMLVSVISIAYASDTTGSAQSGGAFSTDGDWGVINSFLKKIKELCAGNDGTMLGFATSLFGKLILLDFAIAAIMNVVRFGEFQQTFAMLIGKMFKYGFWIWVINNWTSGLDFCSIIVRSFTEIGSTAGASGYGSVVAGAESLESPSWIIAKGLGYASVYFTYILAPKGLLELAINILAPFTIVWKFLLACFGALGILVAFLMILINVITTMIEFYMVTSLGLILIPFAAFDKTEQFGAQNFRYVMGIGIKIMFMSAIVGMMSTTVWSTGIAGLSMGDLVNFTSRPGVGQTVLAVLMAWTFAYVACEVPAIAGAALSGSPALTGHNLIAHAVGAAAAIYTGGAAAMGMAGGAIGLSQSMGGVFGTAGSSAAASASNAYQAAGGGFSGVMKGAAAGAKSFAGGYAASASRQMGAAWNVATTKVATAANEGAVQAMDMADQRNYGHFNPPLGYNDNPYMRNGATHHPGAAPINKQGGEYAKAVSENLKKAGGSAPATGNRYQ